MFWQTSPCNFWSALYTITEICTIVWRRHTNTLLKFWNVSIRLTWLTIASNVLNRSFLAFHRGKLWQKNDFCQFFVVLHKITYDRATKLHGPSHQISKQSMGSYTTIDQVEKCCKMLKNNNQKYDFWNQLCQFVSLLCCIKLSKLHQRANKTTKKTKHGNLHVYNDLANVQKSCFLFLFFSTLIDRCFLDVCEVVIYISSRALFS